MAIVAAFRLRRPLGVRIVRRERLGGEPAGRDGRLLNVNALPVDVCGRQHQRGG